MTEQVFPTSFAQQRLWFIEQMDVAGASYTVPAAWRVRTALDVDTLRLALADLIHRHEALRTIFQLRGGAPVQVILPELAGGAPLCLEDLSQLAPPERDAALTSLLRREASTRFDLERGPLLRLIAVRLGPAEYVLTIVMHHIVCDAWSMDIFYRELSELYAARRDGRAADLPPLPVQYADYAVWQREALVGARLEEELGFWRSQLHGPLPPLELPTDHPRPPIQTFNGARLSAVVPEPVGRALLEVGRAEGATPFITLLAAFQAFLHRESGQDDVLVGSPISGRNQGELEGLIGFFLNTLVYRADLSGDPTFRTCIRRARECALAAYAHQDLPFERLVEELAVERDPSRHPVFQAMFVYQTRPRGVRIAGAAAEPVGVPGSTTAKFDLLVSVTESEGRLGVSFEYNTDLYDTERVRRWSEHLTLLLAGIAADPDTPIGAIPLLGGDEAVRIRQEWKGEHRELPVHRSVIELVDAQVRQRPQETAVLQGGRGMSYAELGAAVEALAGRLQALGIGPDRPVAIALDRSPDMVVAVLAALKAGGPYVPVDPEYPAERIAIMLEDSGAPVLLTRQAFQERLPPGNATVLAVDALPPADPAAIFRPPEIRPEHLAYIIFTSGSTGRPKGVAMPHGPLLNLLDWQIRRSPVGAGGRTLQFASLSFDVSFQEIFATLGAGGTLVLVSEDVRRDPAALLELIHRRRVQRLFLPYIALQHLADAAVREGRNAGALEEIVTAGEALYVTPNIRRWLATMSSPRLDNQYGPSETHVVTAHLLTGDPDGWPAVPPIGRPIQNVRACVLTPAHQPVPQGVPGDLWLGGVGVARGYLHQPALTAERFVDDPFNPGGRIYRSGDLARYLPDGTIEFLGRTDHQVKIRGHRVELGEIEALIAGHSDVAACAVTAPVDASGSRQIVAFVVPRSDSTMLAEKLRTHVRERLPGYMLPSRIIPLASLPLTPSGKVNRRALEVPADLPTEAAGARVAPETTLEAVLIQIWEDLLPGRTIGPSDDFFALGGHSLLAARMVDEIATVIGVKLPLTMLFRGATVRDIARYLVLGVQAEERQELIEVQAGRPGVTPFFMAHGDFTAGGFYCRRLAEAAGPDQPFYAIPPYVPRGPDPALTIEAMAALHAASVRRVQAHGPYRLGGYCAGGLVAYELARRLRAEGEQVELLLVVDSNPTNARYRWVRPVISAVCRLTERSPARRADRFAYLMARVWRLRRLPRAELAMYVLGFPGRLITRRMRRLFRRFRPLPAPPPAPENPNRPPVLPEMANFYSRAMYTYFPGPFDGRVDVLWATAERRPPAVHDLGWDRLTRHVALITTPDTHVGVVTKSLPGVFAAMLARLKNGSGA